MHLFVLRHFQDPFYLLMDFVRMKLPNRPQSDQQNVYFEMVFL